MMGHESVETTNVSVPEVGTVWCDEADCTHGLAEIGLGPTQVKAVLGLLVDHTPSLFIRNNLRLENIDGNWPAVVLAADIRPSRRLLRELLAPAGRLIITGSGDPRFDSLKRGFCEQIHIGIEPPFGKEIWCGDMKQASSGLSDPSKLPLLVSYYTRDTPYQEEATRLINSCRSAGVPHYVCGIPNGGSWEGNCAYKSRFLLELWQQMHRPLLWVDADAIVHRSPVLLSGASCDFAIHKLDNWEFASGTVFFNSTPLAGLLLERWAALCRTHPHIWDQRLLDAAWEEVMQTHPLVTRWLPPSYTAIFDRPRADDAEQPIIVHHQASRRLKSIVSSAVPPSPFPAVSEPWRRARRACRGWLDREGRSLAMRRILDPGYVPYPGTPAQMLPSFTAFANRLDLWLRRYGTRTRRVAIFGASWFGVRIAGQLRRHGIEPISFLDNAPHKSGNLLTGIPVQAPAAVTAPFELIIVASIEHSRIIENQLRDASPALAPLILAAHQTRLNRSCGAS